MLDHRATRLIAVGTPEKRPAWLRVTEGERLDLVGVVLALTICSQVVLPSRFVIHPAYVAPGVELVVLVAIGILHPGNRFGPRAPRARAVAQVLLGLVAAVNTASVVILVHAIVSGGGVPAVPLLLGGGEVWLTNVLVFGLWYWLYDRGGPAARARADTDVPDLLFPQLTDDHLADDWEPRVVDYLYVSLTNAMAFSPTDTMPLSRWAKLLFTVQSLISLVTVALVAARAVNVLPG